jgi:hypothetical protein
MRDFGFWSFRYRGVTIGSADLSFLLAFALAVGWYLGGVRCSVAHMVFWMCSIGVDLASSAF